MVKQCIVRKLAKIHRKMDGEYFLAEEIRYINLEKIFSLNIYVILLYKFK